MKKFLSFIVIGALLFAFGSCGTKTSTEEEDATEEPMEEVEEPAEEMMEEEVEVDSVAADTTAM